ncbi:MAG: hypothetical protein RL595_3158 [Planctomycetota bacterium]
MKTNALVLTKTPTPCQIFCQTVSLAVGLFEPLFHNQLNLIDLQHFIFVA